MRRRRFRKSSFKRRMKKGLRNKWKPNRRLKVKMSRGGIRM